MEMKLELDPLKLYFGEDYKIGNITISQPTLGALIQYGEREYYSMIHTLTSIPSDSKSILWDAGIDYCKISDFEYFIYMTRGLTKAETSIVLNDLDLSKMEAYKKDDKFLLVDPESGTIIDEMVYLNMVSYIRQIHNIKVKPEKTKNKMVRDILIEDDRKRRERHKDDEYKSQLLPLVSALVTSGIYKKSELKDVGLCEFFDSVSRLQILKTASAIMNGLYCGFADYSKNRSILDQANIFRDIPNK